VPNTKEGDEVRVRVTRVLSKVGFAEVIGEASGSSESSEGEEETESQEEEAEPEDTEDFGEDN
jgi:hypothetical protein